MRKAAIKQYLIPPKRFGILSLIVLSVVLSLLTFSYASSNFPYLVATSLFKKEAFSQSLLEIYPKNEGDGDDYYSLKYHFSDEAVLNFQKDFNETMVVQGYPTRTSMGKEDGKEYSFSSTFVLDGTENSRNVFCANFNASTFNLAQRVKELTGCDLLCTSMTSTYQEAGSECIVGKKLADDYCKEFGLESVESLLDKDISVSNWRSNKGKMFAPHIFTIKGVFDDSLPTPFLQAFGESMLISSIAHLTTSPSIFADTSSFNSYQFQKMVKYVFDNLDIIQNSVDSSRPYSLRARLFLKDGSKHTFSSEDVFVNRSNNNYLRLFWLCFLLLVVVFSVVLLLIFRKRHSLVFAKRSFAYTLVDFFLVAAAFYAIATVLLLALNKIIWTGSFGLFASPPVFIALILAAPVSFLLENNLSQEASAK